MLQFESSIIDKHTHIRDSWVIILSYIQMQYQEYTNILKAVHKLDKDGNRSICFSDNEKIEGD